MHRLLRVVLETMPWIIFAFCAVSYLVDPVYFAEEVVAKDSSGGTGLVEGLTVIVLLGGIAFGLVAVIKHWREIPDRLLRTGLILWILACIYFAGEEISWGQWYFQWSTPDAFVDINKQGETNLHNTTSWLNEKPRTLVELWFLFAGLIVAVARFRGGFRFPDNDPREWINPYSRGISACAVFLIYRVLEFGSSPFAEDVSNSEIRELFIAYFLALYLFSVWLKLRSRPDSSEAAVGDQDNKSTSGCGD